MGRERQPTLLNQQHSTQQPEKQRESSNDVLKKLISRTRGPKDPGMPPIFRLLKVESTRPSDLLPYEEEESPVTLQLLKESDNLIGSNDAQTFEE